MTVLQSTAVKKTEYDKEALRKKAVVAVLCLATIALLVFLLSRAKYTTPQMTGYGEYDAAFFNTVLLGDLASVDKENLENLEKYVIGDGKYSNPKKYTVRGEKQIKSKSLKLDLTNELGYVADNDDSYLKLKPGTIIESIPFTVTNGTTVTGDEDSSKNKTANVAKSDIRYTIHVIGGENLPLDFTLIDLSAQQKAEYKFELLKDSKYSENDYVVASTTGGVFNDHSRILKWTGDNNISVHRYELKVVWKTDGFDFKYTDENGVEQQIANTDRRFMKELENIEIRVDVESYVNYDFSNNSSAAEKTGVIQLRDSAEDAMYTVPKTVMNTIHGQKAVSYDALNTENGTLTYNFNVCNGKKIKANWMTSGAEDSRRPSDRVNGYYKMNFEGGNAYGNLKVAIGIPTDETVLGSNQKSKKYKIEYNNKVYTGTIEDSSVNTNVRKKYLKEGNEYTTPYYVYDNDNKPAYKIVTFKDESGNILQLKDFEAGTYREDKLKLSITDSGEAASIASTGVQVMDDFRIYVYE